MPPIMDTSLPQSSPPNDDVHYTVLIRLPFPRGDFVDPPPVSCSLDLAVELQADGSG